MVRKCVRRRRALAAAAAEQKLQILKHARQVEVAHGGGELLNTVWYVPAWTQTLALHGSARIFVSESSQRVLVHTDAGIAVFHLDTGTYLGSCRVDFSWRVTKLCVSPDTGASRLRLVITRRKDDEVEECEASITQKLWPACEHVRTLVPEKSDVSSIACDEDVFVFTSTHMLTVLEWSTAAERSCTNSPRFVDHAAFRFQDVALVRDRRGPIVAAICCQRRHGNIFGIALYDRHTCALLCAPVAAPLGPACKLDAAWCPHPLQRIADVWRSHTATIVCADSPPYSDQFPGATCDTLLRISTWNTFEHITEPYLRVRASTQTTEKPATITLFHNAWNNDTTADMSLRGKHLVTMCRSSQTITLFTDMTLRLAWITAAVLCQRVQ